MALRSLEVSASISLIKADWNDMRSPKVFANPVANDGEKPLITSGEMVVTRVISPR